MNFLSNVRQELTEAKHDIPKSKEPEAISVTKKIAANALRSASSLKEHHLDVIHWKPVVLRYKNKQNTRKHENKCNNNNLWLFNSVLSSIKQD